jgi:hypothetical protein
VAGLCTHSPSALPLSSQHAGAVEVHWWASLHQPSGLGPNQGGLEGGNRRHDGRCGEQLGSSVSCRLMLFMTRAGRWQGDCPGPLRVVENPSCRARAWTVKWLLIGSAVGRQRGPTYMYAMSLVDLSPSTQDKNPTAACKNRSMVEKPTSSWSA